MRKYMMAGNWKMNNTIAQSKALAEGVKAAAAMFANKVDVVLAPSFLAIPAVVDAVKGCGIHVAAQNCCWEKEGAYTGDVSPAQVKDAGCGYVVLGHSERRQYAKEDDTLINKKTKLALANGLKAIVCVGELLAEREANKTNAVVEAQTTGCLVGITADDMKNIVIAYEPVWAIGTGKVATKEQAQEVHAFIRSLVKKLYGDAIAQSTVILYGGSAKPDNIVELLAQPDVDGGLVGGASLKADSFAAMIKAAAEAK